MATLDYVDDWAARLRARLYTQFRDATSWQKWCDEVLGPQAQDLEDAAQSLLTMCSIADSEGAQLDVIGRLIGQPRNGLNDTVYRICLAGRVLANKSDGTPEDLYAVFRALFDLPLVYELGGSKEFAIKVNEAITGQEAAIGVEFLRDSKEVGARGILEWQESEDDSMFYTKQTVSSDYVTTTASSASAGGTTIRINIPTTQPDSGLISISEDGLDEEWIFFDTWDTNGPTEHRLYLHSALVNSHASGVTVKFIVGDGYGFGDVADSSTGGTLAGAEQA